jgi:hypothetical protein
LHPRRQGTRRLFLTLAFTLVLGTGSITRAEPLGPTGEAEPATPATVRFGPTTGLRVEGENGHIALHGYAWGRAKVETRVGDETDLEGSVPIGRVFTEGAVLDDRLFFFAQVEFAENDPELIDVFAEWRHNDALQLRVGQFRTPYSRSFITPLTNIALPTRGLIVDRFGLGRDTGAMLSGTLTEGLFHYDLAVVNGATINDRNGNRDSPSAIARTELRLGDPVPYDQVPSLALSDPHGVTLALGGAYSRRAIGQATGTTTHETLGNLTADVAAMSGPFSFHAEGFWRSAHGSPRAANAFGAYAQAGVFVLPRLVEVGGRAGWLSDGPDQQSYEAFITGYAYHGGRTLGHHLKLILAYRYDSADPSRGSLQDVHTELLQAQIFF